MRFVFGKTNTVRSTIKHQIKHVLETYFAQQYEVKKLKAMNREQKACEKEMYCFVLVGIL